MAQTNRDVLHLILDKIDGLEHRVVTRMDKHEDSVNGKLDAHGKRIFEVERKVDKASWTFYGGMSVAGVFGAIVSWVVKNTPF
jgi:hypothetical protein